MRFARILAVALVAVLLAAGTAGAQDVTLSVAISMKEVTEELGAASWPPRPGVTLRYNFGSSGDLQKQIEAGAPVDVFISAAQRQMDELEQAELIVSAARAGPSPATLLTVIKPADSRVDIAKPADLVEARVGADRDRQPQERARRPVRRGEPAGAGPRGIGCSRSLSSPRTCVRLSTTWLAARLDAGFVYTTDAASRAQAVKEAFRPPDDSYRPVIYPGAVVAASKQPAPRPGFPRPPGQSARPRRAEPLRLTIAARRRALNAVARLPSAWRR